MAATHVIVGAGQAGAWAAVSMRQAGFTGRVLMIGDEPWRPYQRPPLSKQVLVEDPEPPILHFHTEQRYAELEIEMLLGTAVSGVDPKAHRVLLSDGRAFDYHKLLLTVGGQARHLPVHGGDLALYLRTLEDARALRARLESAPRVLCIGAGVIGLEIASSARTRGCEVTVLEALPRAMGRAVSPEGAAYIESLHRAAGVTLHFDVIVERLDRGDGAILVTCRDGRRFAADVVVAGVGMQRNLGLAEAAGLSLEGGIVVDELGRSSDPDIFAAGDVTAFFHPLFGRRLRLESWRHAQNHGIAVGKAMCGDTTPYDDVPWFWTDQYKVNVQVAGLPADAARTVVRQGGPPGSFVAVHLADDGSVLGVTAANNPREIRAGQALIKSRKVVDEAKLVDASVPLQRLM
ncbi:MAG TPA: FAD-dependent oxidoreductase [Acetobacteraceae bacterium]|nr:FAD-dependent oxidoreductase [Acetobacteraceae bacterium]